MLSFKRIGRILAFYFFLLLMNSALFLYEVFIVGMLPEQSLAFRSVTLVTDFFESIIFLEYLKDLPSYILKIFRIKIRSKWLLGGIKLALIGPNVYLIKLFLVNQALYYFDIGIPPIIIGKIIIAYSISLASSFFWGAMWALFIERFIERFISRFKPRCP